MRLLYIVDLLFTVYTFMLIARVIGSWVPSFADSKFMRFIGFYTDPYLNLFRRFIPPLGMIDFSPIVAFIALQLAQYFVIKILQ